MSDWKDLPEDGQKDAEGFGSSKFPEREAQEKLKILCFLNLFLNKKRTFITISAQKRDVAGTFHISTH